jgi:hypothetical protein
MIAEYFFYKNAEKNVSKKSDKEMYYECDKDKEIEENERMSTPVVMLLFIVYLILGFYAARLSWYSNTKAGWSNGYKVLFAIFAFMFPITYITAHIIFKLDLLAKIKGGQSGKM